MTYHDKLFLKDMDELPSFEKRVKEHDYRYDFICEILNDNFISDEKLSLLDFGCSDGLMLKLAKDNFSGVQLRGVEISRLAREDCLKNSGIAAVDSINKAEASDVVVAMQVLEHLDDPNDYFKKLYAKAKHMLIIMVPIEDLLPDIDHKHKFNYYSIFDLCSAVKPKDFHIYMLNKFNKFGNPLNIFAAVIFK